MTHTKINYGLDAPSICYGMFAIGFFGLIVAILSPLFVSDFLLLGLEVIACLMGTYGFGMGIYMVWSSRIGQLLTCETLMNEIGRIRPWKGDEIVLDVGCGRGLLLIGAAKRLTSGKAYGIDLWKKEDQADNSPEAPVENAVLAGVADRLEIKTGDARQIPFAGQAFDIVVSHWVIHNIEDESDRSIALQEIWRVLKPDGVLALADISFVKAYLDQIKGWNPKSISFYDGGNEAKLMGFLSGGTFRPQYLIVKK